MMEWGADLPDMTNPANALVSFQEAFNRGEITLRPGVLDPPCY